MNNKTEAEYERVFENINYIFKNYENKEKFKWTTFTTDFEKPLIKAFNTKFNTNNEIKHMLFLLFKKY